MDNYDRLIAFGERASAADLKIDTDTYAVVGSPDSRPDLCEYEDNRGHRLCLDSDATAYRPDDGDWGAVNDDDALRNVIEDL